MDPRLEAFDRGVDAVLQAAVTSMLRWCDQHLGDFPSSEAVDRAVSDAVPDDELSLIRIAREDPALTIGPADWPKAERVRQSLSRQAEEAVLVAIQARHLSMQQSRRTPEIDR